MIDIKKECTGCHACYNICPKRCIKMSIDAEGFLYPCIDKNECVNCGKCEMVCPILNTYIGNRVGRAFACINKNEDVRMKSSSGGVFTLIAEYVIDNSGVVFGPAFDKDYALQHIFVDKKEELYKLRGSKYLQSKIGNSYGVAEKFLKQGRLVLFTGTPCQISGLKGYLGKNYDNLIMQDIICHGVPSQMVWKRYLEHQEMTHSKALDKEKVPLFRNKEKGWKNFSVWLTFADNTIYRQSFGQDLFMKAFLKDLCLRPSCYNCHSKSLERESDITLADFWGIENVVPEMDDNKGTSLVFVNTEKGENVFEKIKEKLKFCQVDIKEAVQYNQAAYKSAKYPPQRRKFIKNILRNDFDKIVSKYSKNKLSNRVLCKIKRIIKRLIMCLNR